MSLVVGAWLAAVAGCLTGGIEAHLGRHTPSRNSLLRMSVLGALIGALSYAAFVVAGFAVSLLTFSGGPDAGPALLCVVLGCAGFLSLQQLRRVLARRFGWKESRVEGRGVRDLLDARPRGGGATMWLGGVGFALLPVFYGLRCIVTRTGKLGTTLWPSTLEGGAAVALGVGWIGVGLFLHFHFFYGLHRGLEAHSRRGKYAALIAACIGFAVAGAWSVVARVPR